MDIDAVLRNLLDATGASRVTLRQDISDAYAFPVTHEALAPGAPSLRAERTVDLKTQPVVHRLQTTAQVVQDDCRAAFDDPAFQRMLEAYGDLRAQIVTRVIVDGRLAAILSLHQLARRRQWTGDEIEACRAAADRIGELL